MILYGNDLIDIRRIETLERLATGLFSAFTLMSRPARIATSARGVLCQALCGKEACSSLAQACARGFP